jgi:Flp pilus assembly protein TadG
MAAFPVIQEQGKSVAFSSSRIDTPARSGSTLTRRSGTAAIEVSLLLPWVAFCFIGALDWGFFSYALITTANATRVAAEYTSTNSSTAANASAACQDVLPDFQHCANIGTTVTSCTASPLILTAAATTGPDSASASTVTIAYTTDTMIPIPGILASKVTIVSKVQMRLR